MARITEEIMKKIEVTIKENIEYNLETGEMFRIFFNPTTGSIRKHLINNGNNNKYVRVTFSYDKKQYNINAHRIAWFIVYGEWIPMIDHINKIKNDNRINNLRRCTNQQNQFNSKAHKDNRVGFKGVTLDRGRYKASIKHNGVQCHLGLFDTPEQASEVYQKKADELRGEFNAKSIS